MIVLTPLGKEELDWFMNSSSYRSDPHALIYMYAFSIVYISILYIYMYHIYHRIHSRAIQKIS